MIKMIHNHRSTICIAILATLSLIATVAAEPRSEDARPAAATASQLPQVVEATYQYIYKTLADSIREALSLTQQFHRDVIRVVLPTRPRQLPKVAIERKIRLLGFMYRISYWTLINKANHGVDAFMNRSGLAMDSVAHNNPKWTKNASIILAMNNLMFEWMTFVEKELQAGEQKGTPVFNAFIRDVTNKYQEGDEAGLKALVQRSVNWNLRTVHQSIRKAKQAFAVTNARLRKLSNQLRL